MNELTNLQLLLLSLLIDKHIKELEKSINDLISVGQYFIAKTLKTELSEFNIILDIVKSK